MAFYDSVQLSSAYIPAVISSASLIIDALVFRNNLTVLDGIVVQGQGARGEFTLNGKRPGTHNDYSHLKTGSGPRS